MKQQGPSEVAAWAVLIKQGRKPTLIELKPANDPHPHSIWLGKGKDPNKPELTGTSYRVMVKDTLLGKGHLRAGTIQRPRRPINLLHDRDPAHTSEAFKQFAANYNINAVLLPARSPDLNPLDYGVFGLAQKKLEQELGRRSMSWDEQRSFMQRSIRQAKTDEAIRALPGRIQRCIKAKGGHFE